VLKSIGDRSRRILETVRSHLRSACPTCDSLRGYPLCAVCIARSQLPPALGPLLSTHPMAPVDAACHLAPYSADAGPSDSPLRALLVRFKYAGDRRAGYALTALVREYAPVVPLDADIVVPVPLHRERLLARGFNQAAWLARAYARTEGRVLAADAIRRTRTAPPQAGQSRSARLRTVRGVFRCSPRDVAGRSILLVDDVVTTGATVCEAARVIKAGGASRVFVFSLMATQQWMRRP